MGRADNGAGPAGDEPPDKLPGLPPDWPAIVIPDDPAALAEEAALVRSELRRRTGRDQGRHQHSRPPAGRRVATRAPLLIISIAVLVTLAGLLTAVRAAQPGPEQVAGPTATGAPPAAAVTGRIVPALDLVDERGHPVALRALLPAVIILVGEQTWPDNLREAARAAPTGVTVVAVRSGSSPPSPPPAPAEPADAAIRSLADPTAGLRDFLRLPTTAATPATMLVTRSGRVTRLLPGTVPVATYRDELATLAQR